MDFLMISGQPAGCTHHSNSWIPDFDSIHQDDTDAVVANSLDGVP